MAQKRLSVVNDAEHATACHERWVARRNRKMEAPDYEEPWYREQCGTCSFPGIPYGGGGSPRGCGGALSVGHLHCVT